MQTEKKRILLVDDDPDVTTLIQSRLQSNGYEVDVAHSGKEGLERIKSQAKPDLVILDVIMPGLSGYEVCAQIKSDINLCVPVLMLTSRSRTLDERMGYYCHADAYIRKPMSSELLIPEIMRIFAQQPKK